MFLLKRSAFKAISGASRNVAAKPQSFSSISSAALRPIQRCTIVPFQRRFISDETLKKESQEALAAETANSQVTEPHEEPLVVSSSSSFERGPRQGYERRGYERQGNDRQRNDRQRDDRRRVEPESPPNRVLYVGNLYFGVTEKQLTGVFSNFGPVDDIRIAMDAQGLNRGFAHVTFKELDDAVKAREALSQQTFEGRRMHVMYHRQFPSGQNEPRSPRPASNTIFIGNIPYQVSDKDLNDLFRELNNVVDVRVAIDRRTGQPRGFAHAEFADVESAQRAKDSLANKVIYGRHLRLDFSAESPANQTRRQVLDERRSFGEPTDA